MTGNFISANIETDSSDASTSFSTSSRESALRGRCQGILPLTARIEPWMQEVLLGATLPAMLQRHGSPVNLIATTPMQRNISALQETAAEHGVDLRIYFARKANKCLAFVEQAAESNCGVDTASENEIRQCLDVGLSGAELICTAAVKSESLIRLCLAERILVVVDNQDELELVGGVAAEMRRPAAIALRLGGFEHGGRKLATRFGFDIDRDADVLKRLREFAVEVRGVQFHLDGYDASERVSAISESLRWCERLRQLGQRPAFIDIGGGFPMSYLDAEAEWNSFWDALKTSLAGRTEAITYQRHGLGLIHHGGRVSGSPNVYPYYQQPVQSQWLADIFGASIGERTVAEAFRRSNLQLRCEPGRALLDGCGMTVARVEFRKQNAEGHWLIGLSMNRTQCRTTTDDFLVDPIVVSRHESEGDQMIGYLVGAYCTESELLSLRKLRFACGIQRGDLVAFPNTAGYLMHFLESRSHQFELAKNLVVRPSGWSLDRIDCGEV